MRAPTFMGWPRMETRNAPAYEEDFVAWLEDQAQRARRGETDIAEELEGIARSDRREIRNRLTVLLIHLLKYMVQPRRRSSERLASSDVGSRPSSTTVQACDSFPASILDQCYADARSGAASETRLPESVFPESCPFVMAEILDPRWLPRRAEG